MILNALAGIAVARTLGMNDEDIVKGIEALRPMAGRNNIIKTEKYTVIDDCYNANPASMKASLDVLKKANTRKVAILGDMFELGDKEKEMHAEIGAYAATLPVDVLICIGDLSREMESGARKVCSETKIYWYKIKEVFIDDMKDILQDGDTILVKASHGMEFTEIIKNLK